MSSFDSTVIINDKDKIKKRLLDLFNNVEELKKLFNCALPQNSLLKSILKIDEYTDKNKLCEILVNYFGEHFFVYISKIKSDDNEDKTKQKSIVWAIREKILNQICILHHDPDKKRKEILDEFNNSHPKRPDYTKISEMVQDQYFLSKHKWQQSLCQKILQLPNTVIAKPDGSPPPPETVSMRQRPKLKRLYDYQTQALLEIQKLFSEDKQNSKTQRRLLVNIPTGAGKTRLTVEAIVDWLNLRDQKRIPNANSQQKNGRILFWFASTNELCNQAADEFENMYSQIGVGNVNLTRLYGANRRPLQEILDDIEGTHIVVTNTEHFDDYLRDEEDGSKYYKFDKYVNSEYFNYIRKRTIGIVVDEAHEINSTSYQNFLAAMGFDLSAFRAESSNYPIINTNNIVLIGLTATAYKGSGIRAAYECLTCKKIFHDEYSKNKHSQLAGHSRIIKKSEDIDDEFLKLDQESDPDYYKKLDIGSRQIHKTFGGVYVPLPHKGDIKSRPVAVIDVPMSAFIGDNVKLSAINSFDNNVAITSYSWSITGMGTNKITNNEMEFHQKFQKQAEYNIALTVTNEKGVSGKATHVIKILSVEKGKKSTNRTGSLEDNVEFYGILEDRKILSKVTHGVIKGPHLSMQSSGFSINKKEEKENAEKISTAVDYNLKICEIIKKCVKDYGKKRVLVFASSVRHSQELMMILKTRYDLIAESVDGTTNPGVRRKIINDFRKGKIQILCNFGVLTTGFDVPKIDTILICRHTRSNALMTQMIGRGQRGETAQGTANLWLITSNFLVNNNSDLKLGWEALAGSWQKFSESEKLDLGVMDMPYEKNIQEKSEINSTKNKQIIQIDPIENLILKCQTCGCITQGLDNNLEFYGYPTTKQGSQAEGVIQRLNKNDSDEKKFYVNCKFCRQIKKIYKYSKCDFTKFIIENHAFDPNLIFILKKLYDYQVNQDKLDVHWDTLKNDLKKIWSPTLKKSNKEIPDNKFTYTMSSMNKLVESKIIKIENNLNLKVIKIIDIKQSNDIIQKLLEHKELKNKINQFISKNSQELKTKSKKINELDNYFYKLKKDLGHIPTERQFTHQIGKLDTKFYEQYKRNYKSFLKNKRLILKNDEHLKDILYEEYFTKCMKENCEITPEELDKTGDYRLEDYVEMWGSVDKFQKTVKPVLESILSNKEEYSSKRDSEFKLISDDIDKLKQKRPSTYYHFEEIWQYSQLKVFRYIIQLKISHLRYLKNYDTKNIGIFLQLVSDFFRLKKWIGVTPSSAQEFCDLTGPLTTANFMKEFGLKSYYYEKFLQIISVDIPEVLGQSERITKMRNKTLQLIKKYDKENGKEKTIMFIELSLNPNDELSVLIQKYYSDKSELIDLLYNPNSNTDP